MSQPIIIMKASSNKKSSISDADEPSTKRMKTVDLQMKVQMSRFELVGSLKFKTMLCNMYLLCNECLHYSYIDLQQSVE